jgi:hypothetical protein
MSMLAGSSAPWLDDPSPCAMRFNLTSKNSAGTKKNAVKQTEKISKKAIKILIALGISPNMWNTIPAPSESIVHYLLGDIAGRTESFIVDPRSPGSRGPRWVATVCLTRSVVHEFGRIGHANADGRNDTVRLIDHWK